MFGHHGRYRNPIRIQFGVGIPAIGGLLAALVHHDRVIHVIRVIRLVTFLLCLSSMFDTENDVIKRSV